MNLIRYFLSQALSIHVRLHYWNVFKKSFIIITFSISRMKMKTKKKSTFKIFINFMLEFGFILIDDLIKFN